MSHIYRWMSLGLVRSCEVLPGDQIPDEVAFIGRGFLGWLHAFDVGHY